MPIIEIAPPAGFKYHGTDLESEGRWREGSLVRWKGGSLRPVGGWSTRMLSAYAAPVRGMVGWEDNSDLLWSGAGTYNKLYASNAGGSTFDITPAGLTAGVVDSDTNLAYGGGYYGTGLYGQPRPDIGNYNEVTTWDLDVWGQYLVACSSADGKLYEWQLNTGTPAAVISGAPTSCSGLVVTEDRFIFALGAGGDQRKIQWCDFEDNTTWTAASTNQAGDHILQTGGRIMGGIRTQGQTLILTDTDAHRATYVGAPFIYQFERVGSACGLIARKAMAATSAGVFWMGQKGFFVYDGSGVKEVMCDVYDKVFRNINASQATKCWAVSNGQHGEVWFFYPSVGSTEIDSYVAYDYVEGHWLMGSLDRTAGFDRGVFSRPVWVDSSGNAYDHETGFNYGSASIYAETGPFRIGVGENLAIIREMIPDETALGDTTSTFKVRDYPTATETSHGPYSSANPTSLRFQGRQIRWRVAANSASNWSVGKTRFDVVAGGRR